MLLILQEIAVNAINQHKNGTSQQIIDAVVAALKQQYPQYILPEPKWMVGAVTGEKCMHFGVITCSMIVSSFVIVCLLFLSDCLYAIRAFLSFP